MKAKIFTQLMFRHWNHYCNGKRSHLFIGLGRRRRRRATSRPAITMFLRSSLGGQDQYGFSPDGKESRLHQQHRRSGGDQHQQRHFSHARHRRNAEEDHHAIPAAMARPMYSPDGKYIAYRSQLRGGYESDRFRLMLYERATGKITDLTPELRSLGRFHGLVARLEDHLLHRRQ